VPPAELPRPANAVELFDLFAAAPGFEAQYVEQKHLALLAAPLESRGTLYFAPPGHLLRRVTEPQASSVLIDHKRMRVTDRTGSKDIDLSSAPELRDFVTSLARVLAGEREGLAQSWTIDYDSPADNARKWTLRLAPRAGAPQHAALSRMVHSLELSGEGRAVLSIEVREANGDRTLTRIVRADAQRHFTVEEKRELFDIREPARGASGSQ
jgi:hypothetical protein